ncbi:UNKNOWN [Stylonychia lemnae]|uniref:Uncharacterized protein n=1 Tax=Stylonychia lemnae TaxID=5949 RepID=A0A078B2W3_STYLE|nr:UNKNOWN [Stylonychia lemnae]|eukprot:CDW88865.1 UNKNOWN [Stylonychia lemnae]
MDPYGLSYSYSQPQIQTILPTVSPMKINSSRNENYRINDQNSTYYKVNKTQYSVQYQSQSGLPKLSNHPANLDNQQRGGIKDQMGSILRGQSTGNTGNSFTSNSIQDQEIIQKNGKRVHSKDWVQRELFGEIHWKPHRKQVSAIAHEDDPVVGVKKIVSDLTIVKPRIERIPNVTKSGLESIQQSQSSSGLNQSNSSLIDMLQKKYLKKYNGVKYQIEEQKRKDKIEEQRARKSYDFVINNSHERVNKL